MIVGALCRACRMVWPVSADMTLEDHETWGLSKDNSWTCAGSGTKALYPIKLEGEQ